MLSSLTSENTRTLQMTEKQTMPKNKFKKRTSLKKQVSLDSSKHCGSPQCADGAQEGGNGRTDDA